MEVLIYLPVVLSLLAFFVPQRGFGRGILLIWSVVQILLSFALVFTPHFTPAFFAATSRYFGTDPLGSVYLLITAVLFLASVLSSVHYLKPYDVRAERHYTFFLLLFVFSINGLILARHLALMWVFIEATTLSGAMLIYHEKTHAAMEAAWKFIFICSIGIAFAFMGIIFLSIAAGAHGSLFFDDLNRSAGGMALIWLKFAFAFITIGFGAKMGLAPVHAWLPDAHSEAPSPISALLSGALLNGAFLAILRVYKVVSLAGEGTFAVHLMLLMGMMSVFVAAVFMQKVTNFKRMLAYSSIENMGIALIGVTAGGIGIFAAILHSIAHSLTKSSLFLTAGNIYARYHSKNIPSISGLLRTDGKSAALWGAGFFCIVGTPPSAIFLSEFMIGKAMIQKGNYVAAIFLFLLLAAVIYGMGFAVFKMLSGERHEVPEEITMPWYAYAPQILFLALVAGAGIYMPDRLVDFIQLAAREIP